MSEEADTSIDDETAVPILPPPAYLRKSCDEMLANMPTLDAEQSEALRQLRERINPVLDERQYDVRRRAWVDEPCLRRFLRARNWKVCEC